MEEKLTAILLHATDQGDYDKRVCLFSVEKGKVFATMRGVRKAKAKLKFASQPFALCEYEIAQKSGRNVVTGANVLEDLYALSAQPEHYFAGALALEITEKAIDSLSHNELFVMLLKTLKAILYDNTPSAMIIAKFVQKILSMSGFIKIAKVPCAQPKTPSALLDCIAYKRLDELSEVEATNDTTIKALKLVCSRFCSVYETQLSSLTLFEKIVLK